ncbi:MAG: SAM-dependent methyltransferase, partial [Pseudomonadales bacterium]
EGLQEFSHVEVIYVFDKVDSSKIVTGARHPRNNKNWPRIGIFAQRGKNRPNRLGSTICRVASIDGRTLVVDELDAIDGTPVIDLKPVMSEFLPRTSVSQPSWSKELMQQYWDEGDA